MHKLKTTIFFLIIFTTTILMFGCTQPIICGNGVCEQGEEKTCVLDCGEQYFHNECINEQCIQVSGKGEDECYTDKECFVDNAEKILDDENFSEDKPISSIYSNPDIKK